MRTQVGTRVGAILDSDGKSVRLLGFGVYDGDHEPPFGPLGMPKEQLSEMKRNGELPESFVWTNPRITLDDGRVVWGAQCWWGPEEVIRKRIEGLNVIDVKEAIDEASP